MARYELVTTAELADRLGVSRQAIAARVRRKTLKPYRTLANGNYIFRIEAKR